MFDTLQDKLQKTFKVLSGQAKIRESHIEEALAEIRNIFLEADIQFHVVKRFLDNVRVKALGQDVLESLTPYQQFIYILQQEMLDVFGPSAAFDLAVKPPVVIMMVGLQGSGKTTSSSKLAFHLKKQMKRQPLLVSVDVTRPAAIEQLERLAKENKLDVFSSPSMDVMQRAEAALKYATTYGLDTLIVDTAGRLSIDDALMAELEKLKSFLKPHQVLYVADAMSGQQALQVATDFSERVGLTGAILSKADADARGGVAFSLREALKVPLVFVGMGEKIQQLERFYPDRWVSRILGRGDLITLAEKVEAVVQESDKKPDEIASRMMKGKMTLTDFMEQMKMMSKLGSMGQMLRMIPGMGSIAQQINSDDLEKKLKRIGSLILSMTPKERENPDILDGSRKRRISKGSGIGVEELNKFLKDFDQMQKMMKNFKGLRGFKGIPGMGR